MSAIMGAAGYQLVLCSPLGLLSKTWAVEHFPGQLKRSIRGVLNLLITRWKTCALSSHSHPISWIWHLLSQSRVVPHQVEALIVSRLISAQANTAITSL